ncbi:MAG: hypothetical protein R3E68_02270 [Burkholderiaceae bacterium]
MHARQCSITARSVGASLSLALALAAQAAAATPEVHEQAWRQPFLTLLESDDATRREAAMQAIRDGWQASLLPMSLN